MAQHQRDAPSNHSQVGSNTLTQGTRTNSGYLVKGQLGEEVAGAQWCLCCVEQRERLRTAREEIQALQGEIYFYRAAAERATTQQRHSSAGLSHLVEAAELAQLRTQNNTLQAQVTELEERCTRLTNALTAADRSEKERTNPLLASVIQRVGLLERKLSHLFPVVGDDVRRYIDAKEDVLTPSHLLDAVVDVLLDEVGGITSEMCRSQGHELSSETPEGEREEEEEEEAEGLEQRR